MHNELEAYKCVSSSKARHTVETAMYRMKERISNLQLEVFAASEQALQDLTKHAKSTRITL